MYLTTTGKPSKILLKTCKDAIKFYGKTLLSENLYHKVSIKLIFERLKKNDGGIAFCEWVNKNDRPKEFIITVSNNLSKKETLLAIGHEMVHVKQYANGELKDYIKGSKYRYLNKIYDGDEIDYWSQPWEREARGMEMELYVKFCRSIPKVEKK